MAQQQQQRNPLAEGLQKLLTSNSPQVAADACDVVVATIRNVTLHPEEQKYRKIRMANPRFNSKLLSIPGGREVMLALHWLEVGEFLILPLEVRYPPELLQNLERRLSPMHRAARATTAAPAPSASSAPAARATGSVTTGVSAGAVSAALAGAMQAVFGNSPQPSQQPPSPAPPVPEVAPAPPASAEEEALLQSMVGGDGQQLSDEELARRMQEGLDSMERRETEKLARQLQAQEQAQAIQTAALAFRQRLKSGMATAQSYEDAEVKRKALAVIPLQELQAKAAANTTLGGSDALLRELLHWFKGFFTWMDRPKCHVSGKETSPAGMGRPTEEELRHGAHRVELYECDGVVTRFPRYNDPLKLLLDTRSGRCGEWANAFTLCCRAVGLDARYVMDWTDHVWTECWSETQQRWLHCDPCEDVLDEPLLYDRGWGKKLTYVVAFHHEIGPTDVTRRYVQSFESTMPRRTAMAESVLKGMLQGMRTKQMAALDVGSETRRVQLQDMIAREDAELTSVEQGPRSDDPALPGRQTGSVEWRRQRGELGDQ